MSAYDEMVRCLHFQPLFSLFSVSVSKGMPSRIPTKTKPRRGFVDVIYFPSGVCNSTSLFYPLLLMCAREAILAFLFFKRRKSDHPIPYLLKKKKGDQRLAKVCFYLLTYGVIQGVRTTHNPQPTEEPRGEPRRIRLGDHTNLAF